MPRNSLRAGEERRGLSLDDAAIVIPDAGPDAGRRFGGYAAVFNSRTAIGNPRSWGFYESVAPGAFTKTIAEGDQRFLIDHRSEMVVSRVSAGTLHLSQDAHGLPVDSALDDELSYVRDLRANLRNRNVTGMSFGFTVPEGKDEWRTEAITGPDGGEYEVDVRTIREAKLIEVSAVTFPAYEETTASLRHSLVPALLGRGDADAIQRAALGRPDLAPLLGYDAELAPVRIDLGTRADSKKPYGDVAYADPGYQSDGKKRYPLDTKTHVKAAWSYINQAKNAEPYTAAQLASIKAKIQAAANKFGVTIADDEQKSMSRPVSRSAPGSEPGDPTQATDAQVQDVIDEYSEIKGWTNYDGAEEAAETNSNEPAASTHAPSQHDLAKARLRVLRSRLHRIA